jgi:hypothetical protein
MLNKLTLTSPSVDVQNKDLASSGKKTRKVAEELREAIAWRLRALIDESDFTYADSAKALFLDDAFGELINELTAASEAFEASLY